MPEMMSVPPPARFRFWHGVHIPQPVESVDIKLVDLANGLIEAEFPGQLGVVVHSAMPQDLSAKGDVGTLLRIKFELLNLLSGSNVQVLGAVECNILHALNYTQLDYSTKEWSLADVVVASVHTTEGCWQGSEHPEAFLEAYSQIIEQWASAPDGRLRAIGHPFVYADWDPEAICACLAKLFKMASASNVVVGVPLFEDLRIKTHWREDNLRHPFYGLSVLRWQNLCNVVKDLGDSCRLTLDLDAHLGRHLKCLTPQNLALLQEVLRKAGILENFCV